MRPDGAQAGTYHRAMPVLRSRLDPTAPEIRANHDALAALVADLRDATGGGRGPRRRWRRALDRASSRARQAARPGAHRAAARPGLGLPRAEPAGGDRAVRRRGPGSRHRHRRRPGRGHDLRGRRQRRHGQGRDVLPDDRQEAPPRPGDRAREPAAVHLPRRFGRCLPAAPGRGLPRSRPLRPDLLQPGPDVRPGHPAGRAGDGLVHGRWRVRAGDERRDGHRPRHRHDLPRRPAAGEGRDRRGRHARGAGRLRGAHAAVGRRGPRGARRRARARASGARSSPT